MTRKIDPALIPDLPNLDFELSLWQAGCRLVAGVDEAGRGCLAGPVMAAAVILPLPEDRLSGLRGVRDSKQLSPQARDHYRAMIESSALAWGTGSASNLEIDLYGILPATRLAVQRALEGLEVGPDHLLVDYIALPEEPLPQTRLVKGDQRSLAIAAASILAKTQRDALMTQAALDYPGYGFEDNKGYGTALHRRAIREIGPCPLHRMSFSPLKEIPRSDP